VTGKDLDIGDVGCQSGEGKYLVSNTKIDFWLLAFLKRTEAALRFFLYTHVYIDRYRHTDRQIIYTNIFGMVGIKSLNNCGSLFILHGKTRLRSLRGRHFLLSHTKFSPRSTG